MFGDLRFISIFCQITSCSPDILDIKKRMVSYVFLLTKWRKFQVQGGFLAIPIYLHIGTLA